MYGRAYALKSSVSSCGSNSRASPFTILNPAVMRLSAVSVVWPSASVRESCPICTMRCMLLRISSPCIPNGFLCIWRSAAHRIRRVSRAALSAFLSFSSCSVGWGSVSFGAGAASMAGSGGGGDGGTAGALSAGSTSVAEAEADAGD